MERTRQLCTFHMDDLLLGVDVDAVQEVLKPQDMTPVPRAPDGVHGLINLRGQIVTAIDLRRRLALAPGDDRPAMNIVLRATEAGVVSLLVDRIGDVLHVDDSRFEETPRTLDEPLRSMTIGAWKLDDALLLEIDTALVISLERNRAMSTPDSHAA